MKSSHAVYIGDSRSLEKPVENSVDLVVTSPPYPMVEMWDEQFGQLNIKITDALQDGNGTAAFKLMHEELAKVWDEIQRVLKPGGVACIVVGDAARKIGGEFKQFTNHSRIIEEFENRGFHSLPDIIWDKPTNSAAKFMGSGMIPPHSYVTLEHEHILIFRNGDQQTEFSGESQYNSAYFWEERNDWFSDIWTNLKSVSKKIDSDTREQSAAYPFELPFRLINMFSVYDDIVFDPFWGIGTTTIAAIISGRNSIGYEIKHDRPKIFEERLCITPELSRKIIEHRIQSHTEYVRTSETQFEYDAKNYTFPVKTQQEQHIQFYVADKLARQANEDEYRYVIEYKQY